MGMVFKSRRAIQSEAAAAKAKMEKYQKDWEDSERYRLQRLAQLEDATENLRQRLKRRQKHSDIVVPKVMSVYRGMVKVSPHWWGRTVSQNGVVRFHRTYDGRELYMHRITRNEQHHYYWMLFGAGLPLWGHYECPSTYHEARALNESIGDVLGVRFIMG